MESKKKKRWCFVFAALSLVSGLNLLSWLAAWLIGNVLGGISFPVNRAASIGIIGGADGPTSIFITAAAAPIWELLLWILLLSVGIYGCRHFRKQKQE